MLYVCVCMLILPFFVMRTYIDKKSRLERYQGEKGPIDYFIDLDEESESEQDDFIVDDDMIDGEKNTDIESEMNEVEMPGTYLL